MIVLDNGRKVFPSGIERTVEQIEYVRHALLVNRDGLQLWFDADDNADEQAIKREIEQTLSKNPDCRGYTAHRFVPSLCAARGELTAKGTIRRAQIFENRFLS